MTAESLGLPVENVGLFSVLKDTFEDTGFGRRHITFKLTCML